MTEFVSWLDYQGFAVEISYGRRFLWSERTKAFLAALAASAPTKKFEVSEQDEFWRAVDAVSPSPYPLADPTPRPSPEDRIKPMKLRAHEGRVNPKGIPCLYVATDPKTAIAEIRPGIGFPLTLAKLVPKKTLTLIDCSATEALNYAAEPPIDEREKAVWSHMNIAFSTPVKRSDDTADYAPTQLIAELFKDLGYDGVAYRSAFGEDGFNVAFFDPGQLDVAGTWVYQVTDIDHSVTVVTPKF